MEWVNVAVQAGGAIAVCGMFLWFLLQKQKADDEARKEFLAHLHLKDQATATYLRERDVLARDVAGKGYDALKDLAREFSELRGAIQKCCSGE
jgi:hypothetical protein